jgi:hypothetical protein
MRNSPPAFSWWFDVILPAALAGGMMLALFAWSSESAKAHSFYPYECCHDQDCWPMGKGER